MSDAARNHWVSLKTIIDDFLHKAVPKYGTVGSVDSNGNLSIQLVEDDISSLEVYERIAGFDVFPGDQLVCLAMNPGLVALGKLQTAGAVPLALSAGLIGEVVYNGARTAGSVTASTTNTSTWVNAITVDTTLPAGTWTCYALFDVRMTHGSGLNSDLRITVGGNASITLTLAYQTGDANGVPASSGHHFTLISVVSDGVTPITTNGDFRSNSGGTTTPTGPRLFLAFRRTA